MANWKSRLFSLTSNSVSSKFCLVLSVKMTSVTHLIPPKVCSRSRSRSRVEWGLAGVNRKKAGPTHKAQTEKASSPGNVCFEEALHAACELRK